MIKVKVTNKDNFLYTLEDKNNNKTYKANIEFYNIEVNEGDIIYISDGVLDENNIYTYGPIQEKSEIEDIIKIVKEDNEIILQRYYG